MFANLLLNSTTKSLKSKTTIMENTSQKSVGQLMNAPTVQAKFEKLLGAKSQGFISSMLQTVNNSKLLAKADDRDWETLF